MPLLLWGRERGRALCRPCPDPCQRGGGGPASV